MIPKCLTENKVKNFTLNCEVKKIIKRWKSPYTDTTYETPTISLIPLPSTQQGMFYSHSMPSQTYKFKKDADGVMRESDEPFGVQMFALFPHPIAHLGKVSFCRANHYLDRHHLHVMTATSEGFLTEQRQSLFDKIIGRNIISGIIVYPDLLEELTEEEMIEVETYAGVDGGALTKL